MNSDRPLLLTKDLPVRSYDIDVLGIVSNIVYIRWFEDLRTYFLDEYYPFQEMLEENTSPVLKETHIDYQYPITIQDQVKGQVWLSNVGKAKWECAFEIFNDSRVFATGEQIGYFIDVERKRPVRVPSRFKALWDHAVDLP
ncbi:MAG: thioesterase family protein [Cytophagales bacterium]|nr:thioesterase family protein [Cytophagales bacterium]